MNLSRCQSVVTSNLSKECLVLLRQAQLPGKSAHSVPLSLTRDCSNLYETTMYIMLSILDLLSFKLDDVRDNSDKLTFGLSILVVNVGFVLLPCFV